ncbi:MAG: hypothetical protein R2795_11950 [Saprospiraceae bacterium]
MEIIQHLLPSYTYGQHRPRGKMGRERQLFLATGFNENQLYELVNLLHPHPYGEICSGSDLVQFVMQEATRISLWAFLGTHVGKGTR